MLLEFFECVNFFFFFFFPPLSFRFLESFEVEEKNYFASFMDILKNVKIF